MSRYQLQIEQERERFERDTAEHALTVKLDDGLYRHLRFQKPGSWQYGYDLVTWPGFLAYTGDMGEYLFARTADMFDFFAAGPGINPDYWGEKLKGPGHDTHRVFSPERYREQLVAHGALDNLALDDVHDDRTAHERVAHIEDSWEWDFTDYDGQFLWACWAIRLGVGRYRAVREALAA